MTAMMPQAGQVPERPPDPGELTGRARAALADLERSKADLLRRSASGDGSARVLLAAMVVLRDFAAKTEAAWFAATVGAERELYRLSAENDRLRAELEEARQRVPARRRHAAERPLWPRAVRGAAPLAALPAGLYRAGSLLGHQAAAKAALAGTAVAASAAVAISTAVPVPHQVPAPRAAFAAPAAAPYSAVRIPSAGVSASPRARTDARSARAVPRVTAHPVASVPPPSPSSSPPAWVPPALEVPRLLGLGASIRGELTLTAGPGAVQWTATATDGITLSQSAGVAVPGEPVVLQVTDGPARGGWVYITFGQQTIPVEVTTDLAPASSLPSGL